jgi:ATP-dependent DNA helicase RecG
VVTIPFNRINVTPFELNEGQPTVIPTINPTLNPTLKLTDTQQTILAEISKNPNITQAELASILKIQRSSVSESMSKLQRLGVLKRIGGNKTGYWEVIF